jgi:hypothetical protein
VEEEWGDEREAERLGCFMGFLDEGHGKGRNKSNFNHISTP